MFSKQVGGKHEEQITEQAEQETRTVNPGHQQSDFVDLLASVWELISAGSTWTKTNTKCSGCSALAAVSASTLLRSETKAAESCRRGYDSYQFHQRPVTPSSNSCCKNLKFPTERRLAQGRLRAFVRQVTSLLPRKFVASPCVGRPRICRYSDSSLSVPLHVLQFLPVL